MKKRLDLVNDCYNYLKAQNYEKAIISGIKAVELYPNDFEANFCLGKAYYQAGQLNFAINVLRQAEMFATSKQDLAAVYNWLGNAYYYNGDKKLAEDCFTRAYTIFKSIGAESEAQNALDSLEELK